MNELLIKTDIFMDLYKEVEELLKDRGFKNGRSSIMMQFISSPEGRRFKDTLNVCREMRNILAHCPDIGGEAPFLPTDAAIEELRRVADYLKAPPLALSRAVSGDNLVCARLSDRAKPIMEKMTRLGYSHIPVFSNGTLFGVFSISTVFSMTLENECDPVNEQTKIRDFEKYLPITNHVCESFMFVSRTTTVAEAAAVFNKPLGPANKRIAAIFVTQNGLPREHILGMLTPWDVLDRE